MSNCVICLKFVEKPGRPRLDGINLATSVGEFRQKVSTVFEIQPSDFNLVYCGKVLKDADSLEKCGVKTGCTVHILRRKLPEPEIKPEPLDDVGIRQLLNALHAALLNPAHRQAVHKILTSPDTIDNIIAATPGMATDHIAMSMLRDPQLLVQVADPDNVRRIVKAHPAIGHAVMHIAASVTEEAALSGRGGALGQDVPLEPAFFPDLTSDEEMETNEDGSGSSQGQRARGQGGITTAQLTAALAAAGVGRHGNAGMMLRPFEGAVNASAAAQTSTSASSSSQRPVASATPANVSNPSSSSSSGAPATGSGQPSLITADIFRQAMSQALQTAQRISGSPRDSADSAPPAPPPAQNFAPQLQQLRDMGLVDEATNIRALQATGGDLNAALHLILEGRI